MMDISPQWTDDERLYAIALCAQRIIDLANTFNPDARRTIFIPAAHRTISSCADTVLQIACQSVEFLEANRPKILHDIHGT